MKIKDDSGDTSFLAHQEVDKIRFQEENARVQTQGGRPAEAVPILQGITKSALSTESLFAAASFQQTTRVLTEAAIAGKRDYLRGLKENVIIGHLIPAGTGAPYYRDTQLDIKATAFEDYTEELMVGSDEEEEEAVEAE